MPLIYVDTNVFLDFYQSAKDRLAVFSDLLKRSSAVVLTEQTINEFHRNRVQRLNQLAQDVEKSSKEQLFTTAVVQELPAFAEWKNARDTAKKAAERVAKELRSWITNPASDLVLQEFEKLVATAKTVGTTSERIENARIRKLLGQPPTSPDKHTVGDELIWECLLAEISDDLVTVTRDGTFLNNAALLQDEFARRTGKRLSITASLNAGLEAIGQASEKIKAAEKSLPSADAIPEDGRCIRCHVDLDETGFEGSDGDEAWWLYCPKCGKEYFPA